VRNGARESEGERATDREGVTGVERATEGERETVLVVEGKRETV